MSLKREITTYKVKFEFTDGTELMKVFNDPKEMVWFAHSLGAKLLTYTIIE